MAAIQSSTNPYRSLCRLQLNLQGYFSGIVRVPVQCACKLPDVFVTGSEVCPVAEVNKIAVALFRAVNKFTVGIFTSDFCFQAQSALDPIVQQQ